MTWRSACSDGARQRRFGHGSSPGAAEEPASRRHHRPQLSRLYRRSCATVSCNSNRRMHWLCLPGFETLARKRKRSIHIPMDADGRSEAGKSQPLLLSSHDLSCACGLLRETPQSGNGTGDLTTRTQSTWKESDEQSWGIWKARSLHHRNPCDIVAL